MLGENLKVTSKWETWTRERITEWLKVTEKLRPVINSLDHDIYFCCYSCEKGHMTTKPESEDICNIN